MDERLLVVRFDCGLDNVGQDENSRLQWYFGTPFQVISFAEEHTVVLNTKIWNTRRQRRIVTHTMAGIHNYVKVGRDELFPKRSGPTLSENASDISICIRSRSYYLVQTMRHLSARIECVILYRALLITYLGNNSLRFKDHIDVTSSLVNFRSGTVGRQGHVWKSQVPSPEREFRGIIVGLTSRGLGTRNQWAFFRISIYRSFS